jgi:hypothetical protein
MLALVDLGNKITRMTANNTFKLLLHPKRRQEQKEGKHFPKTGD